MAHPTIVAKRRLLAVRGMAAVAIELASKLGIEPPPKPMKSVDPQNAAVKQLEILVEFMGRVNEAVKAQGDTLKTATESVVKIQDEHAADFETMRKKHQEETATLRAELKAAKQSAKAAGKPAEAPAATTGPATPPTPQTGDQPPAGDSPPAKPLAAPERKTTAR